MHSPFISKWSSAGAAKNRRAKLFYLRDRVGKAVRLTEKRRVKKDEGAPAEQTPAQAELAASAS